MHLDDVPRLVACEVSREGKRSMIGTVKLKATYSLHLTNTCRCGDTSGYPVALLERDELPLSRSDLTTLLLNVE
ncbi:hypothetical protein NC652_011749 [Populus alba x Populus x berolinensis]|nr:hypothetical protein NC652_011749 [Populus alba x Populus x berolinensis]